LADTLGIGLGCVDSSAGDGDSDGCEIIGLATGFTVVHLRFAGGAVFSPTTEVSAMGAFGIACLIAPAVDRGAMG
jgi:hypothetical protein